MADPTRGLIKHFANGILQPILPVGVPDNRKVGSIRRPISPLDLIEHLAWRAATEWHSSQSSAIDKGLSVVTVQQDGHFSLGRDGFDFRILQSERTGLWTLSAR